MESNLSNSFQYTLLQALNAKDPSSNVLISPISLYISLVICAKGAKGKTASDIYATLDKAESPEEVTSNCHQFITALLASKSVTAASIILSKAKLLPEYEQICKLLKVDTGKLESAEAVNAWCAKQTHDKIKSIIDSIGDMRLLVLNAIYFEGKWSKRFDPKLTKEDKFTNSKGEKMNCKMMRGYLKRGYHENDKYQIAQLEYSDNSIVAYVLLPKGNINDYLGKASASKLTSAIASCKSEMVALELPVFKLTSSMDLKGIMMAMGIKDAFSEKADFSLMTKENVYIDTILQKTYMSVDEEGTIAAAVTAVRMKKKCIVKNQPKVYSMIVNKPFLFIVKSHKVEDSYLFIAKVEQI